MQLSEENKNTLDIECPHCYKENTINLSKEIKCKHCEKPLIGEKYKKPLITAFTAILLGSGIGMTVDSYLNLNRASVENEFIMMKTCIDEYHNFKYESETHYKEVRKDCSCAVESMLGIIDAEKARFYTESKIRNILYTRYKDCRQN